MSIQILDDIDRILTVEITGTLGDEELFEAQKQAAGRHALRLLTPGRIVGVGSGSTVARFIEASVEGWQSYLTDDPGPADTLIKRANPEMSQELLTWARDQIIANEIVVSEGGRIGDMTAARWEEFFQVTSEAGVYQRDVDWRSAFTLDFLRS